MIKACRSIESLKIVNAIDDKEYFALTKAGKL